MGLAEDVTRENVDDEAPMGLVGEFRNRCSDIITREEHCSSCNGLRSFYSIGPVRTIKGVDYRRYNCGNCNTTLNFPERAD